MRFLEERGNIDDADLNPNLLVGFGGSGGGGPSSELLPLYCRR